MAKNLKRGGGKVNWKIRALRLAIIIATIIYLILLLIGIVAHNNWVAEEIHKRPEYSQPYLHYEGFFDTQIGIVSFYIGGGLFLTWIVALPFLFDGIKSKNRKNVRYAVALLLPLMLLSVSLLPIVKAEEETVYIDVYGVLDEEAWESFTYWCYKSWIETSVNIYYASHNVIFRFHGWYYWLSDNNKIYIDDLLYEAINENYWHWGKTVLGESMEIMIVVTGQGVTGQLGFSPPFERALIVESQAYTLKGFTTLMHEIGHQFMLSHCGDPWCFMNSTAIELNMAVDYCRGCSQLIDQHKREIVYFPPPPRPRGSYHGGGGPCRLL